MTKFKMLLSTFWVITALIFSTVSLVSGQENTQPEILTRALSAPKPVFRANVLETRGDWKGNIATENIWYSRNKDAYIWKSEEYVISFDGGKSGYLENKWSGTQINSEFAVEEPGAFLQMMMKDHPVVLTLVTENSQISELSGEWMIENTVYGIKAVIQKDPLYIKQISVRDKKGKTGYQIDQEIMEVGNQIFPRQIIISKHGIGKENGTIRIQRDFFYDKEAFSEFKPDEFSSETVKKEYGGTFQKRKSR